MAPPLVSTDWLAESLRAPDLVVIDASWHMPDAGRTGAQDYRAGHIPGAVFFDIDAVSDHANPLPHMLPDAAAFGRAMGELGVSEGMRAVVYDSLGLFSAPRVWWSLRAFGMREVSVLDGGLPKWKAEGRPLEQSVSARPAARFNARLDETLVASVAEVLQAAQHGGRQIIDARAADRFRGEAPEPRPGLRAGHIPDSLNLPWSTLLRDGRLPPKEELAAAFSRIGADGSKPVITSCGSGVSAAILSLALAVLGRTSAVYDGSWAEWGGRPELPLATGAK